MGRSGRKLTGPGVPQPGPAFGERSGLVIYLAGQLASGWAAGLDERADGQRPDLLGVAAHGRRLAAHLVITGVAAHRGEHQPAIGIAVHPAQIPAQDRQVTHRRARGHGRSH